MDCGDYVVIVNAKHVKFTGKKWDQKYYKWHTGWVGGLKQRVARVMLMKQPEEIMRLAVTRMMKKNSLRARYERRLLIYPEATHPHLNQELTEFNPIASEPMSAIPRFDHNLTDDYSLRIAPDPRTGETMVTARVFRASGNRRIRAAAKRAGFYGSGWTTSPQDSMYPDTFMVGPALTHAEWKRARELVKTDTKPANWPVRESSVEIDAYIKGRMELQHKELDKLRQNPLPKPEVTTPYLTRAEADELMKNAPKTAPKKK